ncbi:hypothetical protein Halru_2752 [Halovivax ruber XH-70]|uniref:Uncharacterized protein n=1 Tax=Halovivax ruber (strain DSM 18193 / JCM 13892 / XH-70) TaxID=797302 RepID=L0IH96_HALRX|nr:hypothetical protein [Halovivax ruber]AGB17327.1 hypothetical protein Halru_2752 [Halovivax ruber XH-70]
MSTALVRLVDRVRQPEYTGANRCIPCTIVNVVLALAFAIAVGGVVGIVGRAATGALAASVVLVVSLLAIYVRGYLVPGTPTFTKRYFPDRVLAWFDKEPALASQNDGQTQGDEGSGKFDPERILVDGGVTVPCEDEEDLCLADGLRERWRSHVVDVRQGDRVEQVAAFVERDPETITLDDDPSEDRIVAVGTEGGAVAHWESEAALVADLAGARLLNEQLPTWADRPLHERGQIVGGLRAFLETCPACDGQISIDEETVESCCRSYEVYAVTCDDCGARLLEVSA